jgi:hypothetical protein
MRAPPAHKSKTAAQVVTPIVAPQPGPFGHDTRLPRRLKKAGNPKPADMRPA